VDLLWLRRWYQSDGSDRIPLVRHWEFLCQTITVLICFLS